MGGLYFMKMGGCALSLEFDEQAFGNGLDICSMKCIKDPDIVDALQL